MESPSYSSADAVSKKSGQPNSQFLIFQWRVARPAIFYALGENALIYYLLHQNDKLFRFSYLFRIVVESKKVCRSYHIHDLWLRKVASDSLEKNFSAAQAGSTEANQPLIFRKTCGITLNTYRTRYRITRTQEQLTTTNKIIPNISLDNGFGNVNPISRRF